MDLHDNHDDPDDTVVSPAERAVAAARSTWVSVLVNILLTTVQIVAGVLTRSQALIADGIHSLSDLVSDFVVLYANRHSRSDADAEHPYGHHRFETAASLVLGLLLLAVGIGMLQSAFGKLQTPGAIPTVHVAALWVALGGLAAKELLFRYMLEIGRAHV